jgi:hypothetical protein
MTRSVVPAAAGQHDLAACGVKLSHVTVRKIIAGRRAAA